MTLMQKRTALPEGPSLIKSYMCKHIGESPHSYRCSPVRTELLLVGGRR